MSSKKENMENIDKALDSLVDAICAINGSSKVQVFCIFNDNNKGKSADHWKSVDRGTLNSLERVGAIEFIKDDLYFTEVDEWKN